MSGVCANGRRFAVTSRSCTLNSDGSRSLGRRIQSDTMLSGLQLSSLARIGFGLGVDLSTFLRSLLCSRSALVAENLFLRKQLAFYQEHQVRPRRLTDAARISLVLWSRFCDWRPVLVIVKPETLIGWHRRLFRMFWKIKSRPGGLN